jgi:hypothetical protein
MEIEMKGLLLATALAAASPAVAESAKIPANYGEFTALYNKALNLMRGAHVSPESQCVPPYSGTPGYCKRSMFYLDPKSRTAMIAEEIHYHNGMSTNQVCFGANYARRCFASNGFVDDETYNEASHQWDTVRTVVRNWYDRSGDGDRDSLGTLPNLENGH